MEEITQIGAEKYIIYSADQGRIIASGSSYSPEILVRPGQMLITGVAVGPLEDYYVDEREVVVGKAARPSPHHIFDYSTKTWVDPRTNETEWPVVRAKRDSRLLASDWAQLPDVPLRTKEAWAIYRQALRDVTTQEDPFNIIWPQPPAQGA